MKPGFRQKIRWKSNAPTMYSFHRSDADYYYPDHNSTYRYQTFYEEAERLEDWNTFEISCLEPEKQLEQLGDEIKVRIKITKHEIFRIGELLSIAKEVCQESGTKYQDWISENFDFSYETAHNFVNVYKQCFCHRNLAIKLPTSILYKISQPNFNKELREYLFEHGNLETLTNGKFKELVKKYKEGGIEAINNDLKDIGEGIMISRQTDFTFDICENALRVITDLRDKIVSRGKPGFHLEMEEKVKLQNPVAREINTELYLVVEGIITELDEAVCSARKKLGDYKDSISQKM